MSATPPGTEGMTLQPGLIQQAGALAWRVKGGVWQCVLVTSRRTGRWVLPKGTIERDLTARRTAAQELLEEAGVTGKTADEPIGSYRSVKIRPPDYWEIEVEMFAVKVEKVLHDWLEKSQRKRKFATAREAAEMLADPGQAEILTRFAARR